MDILTATELQHQKDLQRLRDLRPMDDDFMRCLFKDNIPLAEFVLRIITGKQDLIITDCKTQKDMKRLASVSLQVTRQYVPKVLETKAYSVIIV
jgi:hypothetical protein